MTPHPASHRAPLLRRLPGIQRPLARFAATLGLLFAAATPAAAQDDNVPQLELESCRVDGSPVPARCGRWTVFEDRKAATGRTIDLHVVVIPAKARLAEPDPVFILAGGPGQAATELVRAVVSRLDEVREKRDIVFVDQRGTGQSNGLQCSFGEDADLEQALSTDLMERTLVESCRDSLDADLTLYTTPIAMDDLDDVRVALGYDQINLYGGSYGTRAGLVYLRRHGDNVRVAILDGVAPPDMALPLPMGRDAQRALEILFDDCEAQAECNERFPELRRSFEETVASLDREPPIADLLHPRTGELVSFPITAELFGSALRGALYDPTLASLIPLTIERAAAGDFQTLLTITQPLSGVHMFMGMFLSVVCAEDYPRITPSDIEEAASASALGRASVRTITNACSVWPQGEIPESYYEPVRSDAPVLVLSGNLDPVTPPSWGEHVLDGLSNATHLIAPGAGHGVAFRSCMRDVITDFIVSGSGDAVDASCAESLARPPFFLTAAGTSP